jgi:hypothetical protein
MDYARIRPWIGRCLAIGFSVAASGTVWAGGTPEHALIIVDPTNPDSMYLANYYHQQRDIPLENFLYMVPGASNYAAFIDDNLGALAGQVALKQIDDHIDYIILAPTDQFWLPSSGTISDACSPVNRFSLTGAYTHAFTTTMILGGLPVVQDNEYFKGNSGARAFSSATKWLNGVPDTAAGSKRYYLGAQLGYTGLRGNTVSELVTMIDRSSAADGTLPTSTFYYCETTDVNRSGPRDGDYPARVADLLAAGAGAQHLMANLPTAAGDVLGIMTGLANPAIAAAGMTIQPGAFCDHLTSWAATFDNSSQVKVSEWIRNGAAGSWGTVEEPCNYPDKFPNPRIHLHYFKGLPLGDATFRNIAAMPFQGMLYGDPLTRPFTHIPAVNVPDAPVAPVTGTLVLTPAATTSHPTATIAQFDLLIDGIIVSTIAPGGQFSFDTTTLTDGWHDLRVLATDSTLQAATGRWLGEMTTNNHGHSISAAPIETSGFLATAFPVDVNATGPGISEVRLVHNGRVVDAEASLTATLSATGLTLGAGDVEVVAEALLTGGGVVRCEPITLNITFSSGAPSGGGPIAASYTKFVDPNTATTLIELPGGHDNLLEALTYTVLSTPAQATLDGDTSRNYRLLRPNPGATGSDTFTYEVSATAGTSTVATVTVVYSVVCAGDTNGDGSVNITDLGALLANFGVMGGATLADGDLDGDGDVDITDLGNLLANFGLSCM